jgi:GNAT superfamily N-acetyltransferase
MSKRVPAVSLSELDEKRFGVRTARAQEVDEGNLASILRFCEQQGVELLIARCPVERIGAAQAMESAGFRLMDTLVYLASDLADGFPAPPKVPTVRPMRRGEEAQVEAIARASFTGYLGHYHADPRLDREQCDQTYVSWAKRCCAGEAADAVLIGEADGVMVGFAAMRLTSPQLGELMLGAVTPSARGRGIYGALAAGGMAWSRAQGATRFISSTQLCNFAAQKTWVRAGMTLTHAAYTFHKWFS